MRHQPATSVSLLLFILSSSSSFSAENLELETLKQIADSPDALKVFNDNLADMSPEDKKGLCAHYKAEMSTNNTDDGVNEEINKALKEKGPMLANLPKEARQQIIDEIKAKIPKVKSQVHQVVSGIEKSMIDQLGCDDIESINIQAKSNNLQETTTIEFDD